MAKRVKKKSGPIARAFVKGLSIILPAVITIAIFAWVWDILRVYVVELTIKGIDSVKIFEPRKITDEELQYLDRQQFNLPDAGDDLDRSESNLRRIPRVMDLPDTHQGLTPPGKERSILQLVLDENGWGRDYDPISGRVVGYNWFDYLLASVLGLTLVVLLGFVARNFFGRKLVSFLEWFVTRVPVIRSIYPHAKQLVEFFFTDDKAIEFDTVAVIEYPRHGLWSIVFVTGTGLKTVQDHVKQRMVTVYVPSSPAPMTGYTMIMPAEDVIQVQMNVEEAMKFVVSGGVLPPTDEQVRPASGAQYALTHAINEQVRQRRTSILRKSGKLKKIEADVTEAAEDDDTPDDDPGEDVTRETKQLPDNDD